jgi:hypothetical protein
VVAVGAGGVRPVEVFARLKKCLKRFFISSVMKALAAFAVLAILALCMKGLPM